MKTLIAGILSLLAGCGIPGQQDVPAKEVMQMQTLDFTLSDMEGMQVTLSSLLHETPAVLDFWATWCGPCRISMPHLDNLRKQYEGKVNFLAINLDQNPSVVRPFVEQAGYGLQVLLDTDGRVAAQYGVRGIPTTYLIDKEGSVAYHYMGAGTEKSLEKAIQSVLR